MRWHRRDKALDLRIRIAQLEADVGFVVSEPELLRRPSGGMRTPQQAADAWSRAAYSASLSYTSVVNGDPSS